ncbi:MAG: nickel/cobalt transporter [Alphaproteobacteria bacterium]|nr:nickel/cobalt transporter [Alphaproteobacteria bacterium]
MLTGGTRRIHLLIVAGLVLIALPGLALAQSPLGIGAAEPAFDSSGLFGGVFNWINSQQQSFYRALSGAVKEMREDPAKLWTLVGLSFAYGVFHAAGPGHGKAVISSYVIANEQTLRRGITISFMAAFMQGAVAILIVGVTYLALRGTGISMTRATHTLEIASYALIAGFGGWLLFRKLRPKTRHAHHHHEHIHDHDHHHHVGPDGVCESCGHSHAPDPAQISGAKLELREAWSAIVAIGLRPCSGALIVLSFALLNGLYLGGFLSVTAMSIGTAITVSILATLAVVAKGAAVRLANSESAAARITGGIEILGAASVLVLGLVLLFAALQA